MHLFSKKFKCEKGKKGLIGPKIFICIPEVSILIVRYFILKFQLK